ncbi:MAG: hypothetical protein COA78_33710 [Blastopirellula sp.]|nr:MAG: hypothetical protein COA78_33710 [Blastopirellula sp.]
MTEGEIPSDKSRKRPATNRVELYQFCGLGKIKGQIMKKLSFVNRYTVVTYRKVGSKAQTKRVWLGRIFEIA